MTKTIDKDQACFLLRERGYDARVEDGVIRVYVVGDSSKADAYYEKLYQVMEEIGYNASWGLYYRRNDDVN